MLGIFYIPPADPARLPLADGPGPLLFIILSYLLFVLKLGPQFMANREPFKLRAALKVYNMVQVLYNSVILMLSVRFILSKRPYDFNCLTVLPPEHEDKFWDRVLCYGYYLDKILDLVDTIFFVLRKSYKQITMLHLIHHVLMPIATYFYTHVYGYGGHLIVMGLLNLSVHIIMYSYYYLASQKPNIKHSLWWKKYITIMQMVQFVLIFLHCIWTLLQANCEVPRKAVVFVIGASVLMFAMFSNFYVHTYVLAKKKSVGAKQQ